jgi:hypothetical protein
MPALCLILAMVLGQAGFPAAVPVSAVQALILTVQEQEQGRQ